MNPETLTDDQPSRGPIIVGIAGRAGAGKDTFAKMVFEELQGEMAWPKRFEVVKFADPLKDIVGILTGDRGDTHVGKNEVLSGWGVTRPDGTSRHLETRRKVLQWLGTDVIRAANIDAWVECYARALDSAEADAGMVFTTDVRFPNEARFIRRRGGHLVRVLRPGLSNGGDHASETALDEQFMPTVLNNGSLDALRASAHGYAHYLIAAAKLGSR